MVMKRWACLAALIGLAMAASLLTAWVTWSHIADRETVSLRQGPSQTNLRSLAS